MNDEMLFRKRLLRGLWDHAKMWSYYRYSGVEWPSWDEKLADVAVEADEYIEDFQGRPIRMRLSAPNFKLYDRYSDMPGALILSCVRDQSYVSPSTLNDFIQWCYFCCCRRKTTQLFSRFACEKCAKLLKDDRFLSLILSEK
jgi:hypothetical protein